MMIPESETLSCTIAPMWPSRPEALAATGLFHAVPVAWRHGREMRNSAAHPFQTSAELRGFARSAPVMDFDLRIGGPQEWSLADQSVAIPAVRGVAPGEAALWQAPLCDFTGLAIALGDFVNAPLSPMGPEEAGANPQERVSLKSDAGQPEVPAAAPERGSLERDIPGPAEVPGGAAMQDELRQSRPALSSPPALLPAISLPVVLKEAAAGRAKPVQVFASWLPAGQTPQAVRSAALPLRPVMVLAPAESETLAAAAPAPAEAAPASSPLPNGKSRKAEVRILPLEKPLVDKPLPEKPPVEKPEPPRLELPRPIAAHEPLKSAAPVAVTVGAPAVRDDLGLPEFRVQTSRFAITPRMWMVIAVAAGVLILAAIFLFATTKADSTPRPAAAAVASDWVADFAPDPERQRRVSLLRSSANAADYRVEFESAIRMKALGWVYRARDPRNYYVSKIELRTPGAEPAFVVAHYAVIDGIDQARTETPLRVRVPMGTNYRIRFEAAGSRFTTWIQDQKVDEWTDRRLASGGAGLYSEGIEQARLNGAFQVTPLDGKK